MSNAQKVFLRTAPGLFKGVAASAGELRRALAMYLAEGMKHGLSQGELVDCLGVSAPSVLDLSGFSEAEQEQAMLLLGELADAEIQDAQWISN